MWVWHTVDTGRELYRNYCEDNVSGGEAGGAEYERFSATDCVKDEGNEAKYTV